MSWFTSTGLGKFVNTLLFGLPGIISNIADNAKNSKNTDGSSNGIGGVFNSQNYINAVDDIVKSDDYIPGQQTSISDAFSNTFGGSLRDLLGALANRVTGEHLTGAEQEANAFNAEQTQLNRDFEREMASTQYQRGVADMQAAGVNPALAMSQGGNAAPSGVAASSVQPQGMQSMSDLMHMLMVKPQIDLMEAQASSMRENAAANIITAKSHARSVELAGEELHTVRQPLALNTIRVGDTVVSLNNAQVNKIGKEIEQLSEDVTLTKLHQIASALDIVWKGETWEDSKKVLSSQIAKNSAEAAYSYALSKNAGEEYKKLVNERKWSDIYYKYWSDPKNSDRGVNIEMLQGTNLGAIGMAYIQAFGDNLGNNEPGAQEYTPPYKIDGLGR